MKVAYFDLETTDLNAEFGRLLCVCILSLPDNKFIVLRQDELVRAGKAKSMSDDRALAIAARNALEDHHLTAGWYTKGFDISFLNSRLMAHKQRPLNRLFHIDGIWAAKGWRGIKAASGKLDHVSRFLGVGKKMVIAPETWIKAREGQKKAMNEIVKRCKSDVELTKDVIGKMLDAGLIQRIQRYP